ncbi:hypothetical protein [Mycoplasma bradburyae]|uniref:Uncharacterized protein n=1 Tax=Mycoplasma bradburyae TaxID=2963128 RepID=A0AAW6HSF9_9MOLU|nr:hypothetical protein [Mycoplasma bradburyae]MDC4163366.1 hypothetical protein [Mycoplasma bradburyae]MDC4181980.1 hypothetical protein [Mycoplasma bradburyae]MDC4182683.1 hypothetical protein [Mycoplasma bradburyae]MDC4183355.1 hypothetical protein [Mycoplasma bradburyae]MDC4184163.1 hypothetical protein [Mycoplasma bradburyae]
MRKLTTNDKNLLHGGSIAAISTAVLIGQMVIGSISKSAVTISNIVNDIKNKPDPNGYAVGISNEPQVKHVYSSFAPTKARYSFLSPYASSIYSGL